MEYYFNELDPVRFQRLINAVLVLRFGEHVRLTPLRGQDGGRDAETAPANPFFEFQIDVDAVETDQELHTQPRQGRYLFQVKHHRTLDKRLSDVRREAVSDFQDELARNVLTRRGDERVNYFYLITNVPGSRDAFDAVDSVRRKLLSANSSLHADVWWQEQVTAYLDQMPEVWVSFPEIFAGGRVPFLGKVAADDASILPRALRLALGKQFERDKKIKFRQIELEQDLSRLFVDLDANIQRLSNEEQEALRLREFRYLQGKRSGVI